MCIENKCFFDDYVRNPEKLWESSTRRIDKNGLVYHVFQRGKNRERVFSPEVARFRNNMLCKLCADYGVVILFSVIMPNHTHDVLAADSWEKISKVMKILNTKVSQYARKCQPEKYKGYDNIFDSRPTYKPVKDRVYLFYLGKYLYENPAYLVAEGKFVPYSCFWMFEKGYFVEPYRKELYVDLFGMTPKEIFDVYSTMTKEEVMRFASKRFYDWSKERNDGVFKFDPSIPWIE